MSKIRRRMVVGVVVLLLLLGLRQLPALAEPAYDGSASTWALPEIADAQNNGLLYPDILSRFTTPITREEFCVISVRLYEKLSDNVITAGPSPFSDTSNPEVTKANMLGIVLGTGAGKFSPHNNITRQELCVMIYRTLDKALPGMSKELEEKQKIADEAIIASWAKEEVAFCVDRGIVKGVGGGKVDPLRNTTREESIAIINRTFESHKETAAEEKRSWAARLANRVTLSPSQHLAISNISTTDKLRPSVQLSNGKTFYLQPSTEPIYDKHWSDFKSTDLTSILDQIKFLPPAATVDLRKYQTPIKSQEGRGTCVSFATCAAIEAAYKRYDPVKYANLDLSEQYTNLVQHSQALKETPRNSPATRENSLGRWGSGNTHHVMALYSRLLGIPEEQYLPYIGDEAYESYPRDSLGSLDFEDEFLRQDRVNDMNLNLEALPVEALVNARYGVSEWGSLNAAQIKDLDIYRSILRSEREIIFAINIMTPDPSPKDNVWDPGWRDAQSAHAMLMVGYDDDREVFIVKNSWGYDNILEDGFTLMSYDWVTKGYVGAALFVNDIVKHPEYNTRTSAYLLGQWNLVSDGEKTGRLDVSHIPDFYHTDRYIDPKKFGVQDNRIGLLSVPGTDGWPVWYRVNGTMSGPGGHFWLNLERPGTYNYNELAGDKYSTSVFTKQPELMAGFYESGGKKYGFYATKGEYLESVPQSTGNTITLADFIGSWELNHDGEIGVLRLKQALLGRITGTYQKAGGSTVDVSGYVDGNKLTLNIPFEDDYVQQFEGYMHAGDKGLISGRNNYRYGTYFGWIARRVGDATIQIDRLPGGNLVIPNLPWRPSN